MPSDKHNDDNTVTVTLTLRDLLTLEGWGDHVVDAGGNTFDDEEQQLYDRISGLRTELEVHAGTHGA
jgi:hypothetical protein